MSDLYKLRQAKLERTSKGVWVLTTRKGTVIHKELAVICKWLHDNKHVL